MRYLGKMSFRIPPVVVSYLQQEVFCYISVSRDAIN